MKETNLDGNMRENRLKLDHHSVDKALMEVNENHKPYPNGYISDFSADDYIQPYQRLFYEMNKQRNPGSIDVTFSDYRGGYAIWCFNLSDNKVVPRDLYPPSRSGSVSLTLHLKEGSGDNLAILVVLEHERVYRIEKNRSWKDDPAA